MDHLSDDSFLDTLTAEEAAHCKACRPCQEGRESVRAIAKALLRAAGPDPAPAQTTDQAIRRVIRASAARGRSTRLLPWVAAGGAAAAALLLLTLSMISLDGQLSRAPLAAATAPVMSAPRPHVGPEAAFLSEVHAPAPVPAPVVRRLVSTDARRIVAAALDGRGDPALDDVDNDGRVDVRDALLAARLALACSETPR